MPPKNRISAEEAAENRRVELELQLLAEELAAMKKIVRFLYGYLVRSALRKLVMLEDEVLKRPLPGPQACLELQPGGPKEASRPVSCDGSFKSVGSRPGSGASGSRVAAGHLEFWLPLLRNHWHRVSTRRRLAPGFKSTQRQANRNEHLYGGLFIHGRHHPQ
ncbi:unnamed protein product [Polarella glacialis]|uniref:OmpA-like domain-containing protein n=1 Tax=Polarella glacialis TaxID=89957 RepID=A0A813ID17_POLGL|nr:unnamed protein product [Polarella glacialis]